MFEDGESPKKPGRPTIGDNTLIGRRDRLVWLLSVGWPDIGWELPRAKSIEELHRALAPLRKHPSGNEVEIFMHSTSAFPPDAKEIRRLRKELGNAIDCAQLARDSQKACADSFRQAEAAVKMNEVEDAETELKLDPHLDERKRNALVSEFKKRQAKLWQADAVASQTTELERKLRSDLMDNEAAFAQFELLDYIVKADYARDPLGLANAMAGLPDLGWSQSHSRCSKIGCDAWPTLSFSVVQTVQKIWNKRIDFPEISPVELFRREIQQLPKKTLVYYKPENRRIWMPNTVRSHIAPYFMYFRQAIEETLQSKMHPGRIPFSIVSIFEKKLELPRSADDFLQLAHEEIE